MKEAEGKSIMDYTASVHADAEKIRGALRSVSMPFQTAEAVTASLNAIQHNAAKVDDIVLGNDDA